MKNKTKTVVMKVTKFLSGHDGNGQMNREVNNLTLPYDSIEYHTTLKNLNRVGFDKVEFMNAFTSDGEIEGKELEEIKASVEKDLKPVIPKTDNIKDTLEAQSKLIEEQKQMIEKLLSGKQSEPEDDDKAVAVEYYKEAFGKKPHHSWTTEQILEKIEELKSN